MSFIKRAFVILLTTIIVAIGVGYYYGLRPDNVKEYISSFINEPIDGSMETDSINQASDLNNQNLKSDPELENTSDTELIPLPKNPFQKIDNHSLSCPFSAEKDIKTLSNYLAEVAQNDLEKARAIYIWITDNISYDDKGYNSGIFGDNSADGTLSSRVSVCEGFSNLYLALGKEMGLEIKKMVGYAKGYSYKKGESFEEPNHAWNCIKIGKAWRIFDATWGQGSGRNIGGELSSAKKFNNYWFNVDPYEAIFSHLPKNLNYAFVKPAINLKTFEILPEIETAYFQLGFEGKIVYQACHYNKNLTFPKCSKPETHIEVISAPKFGTLKTSKTYSFKFYIPRGSKLAMVDHEKKWTHFKQDKGVFSLEFTPKSIGDLSISVNLESDGLSYYRLMKYSVESAK